MRFGKNQKKKKLKARYMLYDLTMLRNLSNNDEAFIIDMLQTFIKTNPPILERMKDYTDNNKFEAAGREAHKMIPGVSFIGAVQLKEVLIAIEEYSKNSEQYHKIQALVSEAHVKTNELIACFNRDFNL
jgi:HPt (histidine-containing phosphotransfer) domain-containing protein